MRKRSPATTKRLKCDHGTIGLGTAGETPCVTGDASKKLLPAMTKLWTANPMTTGVGISEERCYGNWADITKPLPATRKRWKVNQKMNMPGTTKLAVMRCSVMLNKQLLACKKRFLSIPMNIKS